LEIEAATVEELLRLLGDRERAEAALAARRGPLRSAVFVARTLEERSSRFGHPKVTRRVVAAFAHGPDLVCCRRTTSSAVELPEMAATTEGRQIAAYEGMRAEIARGLKERVSVYHCTGAVCAASESPAKPNRKGTMKVRAGGSEVAPQWRAFRAKNC